MKFDEICDLVLIGEADYDTLSGKAKVFSLSEGAEEIVKGLDLNDIKVLIKKTTLPFTAEYIISLVMEDLTDYLPAETKDLKTMLKRNVWSKFDDTEKKSARAAEILFAFLKKKKIITPGIPKNDEPVEDEIEKLAGELETDINDPEYNKGLSMHDVGKFGGVIPRSTGHPEDESQWY